MRNTGEETQATREDIMFAALEVFALRGWGEATYEQIAVTAGLTRGAVHHHFKRKTDLLREALELGWHAYGERLLAHLTRSPAGSPVDRLSNFIADYITLLHEDGRFRALAAATVIVAPVALDLPTTQSQAIDHWRAAIAAVAGDVRPPPDLPPVVASRLVITLLLGLTAAAVRRPADIPEPQCATEVAQRIARALLRNGT